jgi:multiple sugar transport system substrate-binding protein
MTEQSVRPPFPLPTRRRVIGLTAATLASIPALACGSGAANPAPRALDKSQRDQMTWLVWSSDAGARKEAYDKMQQRFAEQFPNVTVDRIAGGAETMPKLTTLMASDTRVDIVGTRPDWLATYVEGLNPLQNLRDFMKRDSSVIKESDHSEGLIDGLSWKGTLYALPVGVYTNNLCLNLDLFERNNIRLPSPNWTIDEAMQIAQRVTVRNAESPDASLWGFFQSWQVIIHFPYTWIRGNGGEPLVPNDLPTKTQWSTDPETVRTIQWLVDLSHKTGVMPVEPTGGTTGIFNQGRVAINVNETNNLYGIVSSQAQGGAQFRWDVHPLPVMKKGRYHPVGAFAYGVSRNTKNPDVTWELLKQIVGPEGQTDWFRLAKFAPSIKSLLNGAYLQDKEPPASKQVIVDSLMASKSMPKSPKYPEINTAVTEVFTDLRAGKVAVNAGLSDLDRRINAILAGR